MKTYSIRKPISSETIMFLVCTAVEGGIAYWAEGFKLVSSENKPAVKPWYSDIRLYEGDFVIRVTEHEESTLNQGVDHDLTPEKMQKAFDLLSEKYPHVVTDILRENYDGGDADCFIQAAIFGSIVYG